MFAPMMAAASGGSNVKSGTTAPTTTASEEITIDTGLSQINRFVWFAINIVNGNPYGMHTVNYNRDINADKFSYAACGRFAGEQNVAYKTSANAYATTIKNISGGTVTLLTSNNVSYKVETGYWYAE